MPVIVRIYAVRQYDETLKTWSKSRQKYTLEDIARFPNAEPILDEWEEVQRPTSEEQERNRTGVLWRDG